MRLQKLWYKEQMAKLVFLELLRDDTRVTHEDNKALCASCQYAVVQPLSLTFVETSSLTVAETQELKSELKATKAELSVQYSQVLDACNHLAERAQSVKSQLDEGNSLVETSKSKQWELELKRSDGPEKVGAYTSILYSHTD